MIEFTVLSTGATIIREYVDLVLYYVFFKYL